MEVLRRHTVYLGWTEHHEVVERFWRVMSQLTDKDRSQFLRFAWGRSRLPKEDPWPRPFKLTYKNAGDEMLPIAHTCFFQLELPQYTTDKIMHDRLLVAINYGVSGEFMLRCLVCCDDGDIRGSVGSLPHSRIQRWESFSTSPSSTRR